MTRYRVLIENEQAADFILERIGNKLMSFYTTSPWLIEKRDIRGSRVYSLEKDMTIERMGALGRLGYAIAEALSSHLGKDDLTGVVKGKPLLGLIQKTFFVLAYKADLMSLWREKKPPGTIDMIVGNPIPTEVRSFNPFVGRFDTLFAALAMEAQKEDSQDFDVIDHVPREGGRRHIAKMEALGQSVQERILSSLNMPLSVIRYKWIKKGFHKRRIDQGKPFAGSAWVLRDCELLEETIPVLKRLGWRVAFDDLVWLTREIVPKQTFRSKDTLEMGQALDVCLSMYKEAEMEADRYQRAALRILLARLFKALEYAEPLWEAVNNHFDDLLQKEDENPVVFLTNALTSPGERLIFLYAQQRRVPLFSFEHGITAGLSQLTTFQGKYSGMHESHHMFFLTPCAMEHQKKVGNGHGNGTVSGAPMVLKNIKWKALQNRVSRLMLGVPARERVILYTTLATQNNMIYGPGGQNDTVYYGVTKSVIQDVFSVLKDVCILKLYPTNRYLDPDPFADLIALPDHVKRIQYFEFRYLRALADVLIVDSALSTLAWAWSAHVPLIYLDLPSNPLLSPVADAFDRSVFRIDCFHSGWADRLRALLLLPRDELVRQWKNKRPFRQAVEETYVFGPKGRAGKRSAQYIHQESPKWWSGHIKS